MSYIKFLKERDVFLDMEATDRNDAIYRIVKSSKLNNKDKIFKAVVEREDLRTTAIGEGVALPHARLKFIKEIMIKYAILKNGIDFSASDDKPVNHVFLVLAPYTNTPGYLAAIARLVRIVTKPENRDALAKAKNRKDVLTILKKGERD